jgi:hypothetical protein
MNRGIQALNLPLGKLDPLSKERRRVQCIRRLTKIGRTQKTRRQHHTPLPLIYETQETKSLKAFADRIDTLRTILATLLKENGNWDVSEALLRTIEAIASSDSRRLASDSSCHSNSCVDLNKDVDEDGISTLRLHKKPGKKDVILEPVPWIKYPAETAHYLRARPSLIQILRKSLQLEPQVKDSSRWTRKKRI